MDFYRYLFVAFFALAAVAQAASLTKIHSHNDYSQKHPLDDALAENISSVEADVWLRNGEIRISHLGISFKGTLEDLYLKPLQKRVRERHSVYGDGANFYLWIDLKGSNKDLIPMLHALLEHYDMLTVFSDDKVIQKPVTVILTGDDKMKKDFVENYKIRRAIRDSNDINASDPKADNKWGWYSIDWNHIHDSVDKLKSFVDIAHAKNRKIRFWNIHEEKKSWAMALKAGVDQISADNLHEIREFILSQP